MTFSVSNCTSSCSARLSECNIPHSIVRRRPFWVDDQPAVVRADEPLHPDVSRLTIHLDLGDLGDDRLTTEGVRDPASGQNRSRSAMQLSAKAACPSHRHRQPREPLATERARLNPLSSSVLPVSRFSRNSTGSAWAAAASSSMNDSEANVTCGPLGSRRLPVRSGVSQIKGSRTTWAVVRRLRDGIHSDGVAARPLFGVASRVPMSCAIKTVSTSLYPTWL